MVAWDQVRRDDVLAALQDYDRLGPEKFFSEHGYGPNRSHELIWNKRHYPHKAILGTAYEIATGQRLTPGDFEGGKAGAVRVLVRALKRRLSDVVYRALLADGTPMTVSQAA
jgi:hypothetical protein